MIYKYILKGYTLRTVFFLIRIYLILYEIGAIFNIMKFKFNNNVK